MERCAGDLQKFIENKLRVLKEVIASQTILVQLSVGLSYLHEKGIVHRDLKPQNILLSEISSEVFLFKLADFGLSKQQHFTPTGATAFSQTEIIKLEIILTSLVTAIILLPFIHYV
jgi:serine/threonine protein kinase